MFACSGAKSRSQPAFACLHIDGIGHVRSSVVEGTLGGAWEGGGSIEKSEVRLDIVKAAWIYRECSMKCVSNQVVGKTRPRCTTVEKSTDLLRKLHRTKYWTRWEGPR